MEVQRIITNIGKDQTSTERTEFMVKQMEKHFNTGPIIGEARELLLHLAHNLMVRDLILDSMGLNEEQRQSLFVQTNDLMDKRDAKILAKREKKP